MMRLVERVAVRAKLPLRYSEGFNPRPRISLACPRPVGMATRDDLLAIRMTETLETGPLLEQLNSQSPRSLRFLSAQPHLGLFRDHANVPAHTLMPLAPELSLEEATLIEPLAIVLHSMKFAQPQLGETAAVLGAGPIGLLTVLVLKLAGVSRVWAVEPVGRRRELARQMGAEEVIDPAAVDPVRQIRSETGERGVDLALDCAAKGDSLNQCLRATRKGGRFVLTGIPSATYLPLDIETMRLAELAFFNVRRSATEFHPALELLGQQRARLAPLLTHEFPLEDIERAFSLLERYEDGVAKIVIKP